jgi:biopolymer transport protein TolR
MGADMANAVRNQGGRINSTINVTPMVDVMLVLLIVFMVITPLLEGPRVQLVKATNPQQMPDAEKDDALLVAINREGQIFLGTDRLTSSAELTQRLRDRIAGRSDRTVFVKADARSRYSTVAGVVDDIRSAGVSDLGLLTERKRQ